MIDINHIKVQFDNETPQEINLGDVSYNRNQTLTEEQKETARHNIDAGSTTAYLDDNGNLHFTDIPSGEDIDQEWYENITAALATKSDKPSVVSQTAPTAITLADNTEYYLADVSDLTLTYPAERFESWIRLTTATEGTITITLPTSQYIGDEPTFGSAETWEISVKDGVVVAQKVGA